MMASFVEEFYRAGQIGFRAIILFAVTRKLVSPVTALVVLIATQLPLLS